MKKEFLLLLFFSLILISGVKAQNKSFLSAVIVNDTSEVKSLIETGADLEEKINFGESKGMTPLYLAGRMGWTEVAKLLINAGANVNAKASDGSSVLTAFLLRNNTEVIKLLLEAGADLNIKVGSRTPLMIAAVKGNVEIINLLLNSGVNINETDKDGLSALMWAVSMNQIESVKILLKNGADKKLKNKRGQTALIIAKEKKYQNIINLLAESKVQ